LRLSPYSYVVIQLFLSLFEVVQFGSISLYCEEGHFYVPSYGSDLDQLAYSINGLHGFFLTPQDVHYFYVRG
jgi:hypothetical protein